MRIYLNKKYDSDIGHKHQTKNCAGFACDGEDRRGLTEVGRLQISKLVKTQTIRPFDNHCHWKTKVFLRRPSARSVVPKGLLIAHPMHNRAIEREGTTYKQRATTRSTKAARFCRDPIRRKVQRTTPRHGFRWHLALRDRFESRAREWRRTIDSPGTEGEKRVEQQRVTRSTTPSPPFILGSEGGGTRAWFGHYGAASCLSLSTGTTTKRPRAPRSLWWSEWGRSDNRPWREAGRLKLHVDETHMRQPRVILVEPVFPGSALSRTGLRWQFQTRFTLHRLDPIYIYISLWFISFVVDMMRDAYQCFP